MRICNSCQTEITKEQKTVKCEVCDKTIHKECAINKGGTFCDVCYLAKSEELTNPTFDKSLIPDVIRRSHIQTYIDCPFKFYNEVILGHKQPENIYAQIGIDTHELFDHASNATKYIKEDMYRDYKAKFDAYPDSLFETIIGDATKEDMYKRGTDSIETFYNILPNLPFMPYQTEQTLIFDIGSEFPNVQATSDRIDMVDGELEVQDWKTGNVMVGITLSHDIQAPLYIYSIKKKYNIPVRKFTFYYLKDNKTRTFERVNADDYICTVNKRIYKINLTDAIRQVQHVFSQINKGNFNIPSDGRKMYFHCKMCHIKQLGLCEGADIQSWQQYNK